MTIVEKIMGHLGRYTDAAARLKAWLTGNGVEVPDGALIDEMAELVEDVPTVAGEAFEITNAAYLFYGGARVDDFATYAAKIGAADFTYIFGSCDGRGIIDALDLSTLPFERATDLTRAFNKARLSEFAPERKEAGTEYVSAQAMFMAATGLTRADFSKLRLKLSNCSNMFQSDTSLAEVDLSGISLSGSATIASMFYGCTALKSVDLASLYSVATTSGGAFYGCKALEEILNFDFPYLKSSDVFPAGTSSAKYALKRLTFKASTLALNISIPYCAMEVEGFREMANTLPAVSGKKITLTGNPCITGTRKDGTACDVLTDEDRAIATAKGWTLVE